jgi:hypothetical protein
MLIGAGGRAVGVRGRGPVGRDHDRLLLDDDGHLLHLGDRVLLAVGEVVRRAVFVELLGKEGQLLPPLLDALLDLVSEKNIYK